MSEPVNYMDLQEFKDFGYLQEVNRRMLHPLGLALEWSSGWTEEDVFKLFTAKGIQFGPDAMACVMTFIHAAKLNTPHLSGVWDYRDDPEGIRFEASPGESAVDERKAANIEEQFTTRAVARGRALGYVVQPVA